MSRSSGFATKRGECRADLLGIRDRLGRPVEVRQIPVIDGRYTGQRLQPIRSIARRVAELGGVEADLQVADKTGTGNF